MPDKSIDAEHPPETIPGGYRWAPLWNRMKIFLQFGVPLLVLVLAWYEIRKLNMHMVRQALAQSDRDLVALGILFAFLAVVAIGDYDALVFPSGPEDRLTFGRRWLIGSLLFSWTNFVSMGPIGGPALRMLVYRKYGVRGLEITRGLVAQYTGITGGLIGWLVAGWIVLPGWLDHLVFRVMLATLSAAMMLFLVRGLLRGYRSAYLLSMALFAASALAPTEGGRFRRSNRVADSDDTSVRLAEGLYATRPGSPGMGTGTGTGGGDAVDVSGGGSGDV